MTRPLSLYRMTLNRVAIGSETTLKPTRSPSVRCEWRPARGARRVFVRHVQAREFQGQEVTFRRRKRGVRRRNARPERRGKRRRRSVRPKAAAVGCSAAVAAAGGAAAAPNRPSLPLPLLSFRLDELTFRTHTSTLLSNTHHTHFSSTSREFSTTSSRKPPRSRHSKRDLVHPISTRLLSSPLALSCSVTQTAQALSQYLNPFRS